MRALDLVHLTPLMELTSGRPDVSIGLIDGPVATQHADLAGGLLRELPRGGQASCTANKSAACLHGTFVAGILSARRGSIAPAISPDCTLLVRPIFVDRTFGQDDLPSASPHELAAAILECIAEGARVLNLSLGLAHPSTRGERALEEALTRAAKHGVIVVAAAGNQGAVGSSAITRHPWVIPVVACDSRGRPTRESNLGRSIARNGLSAPGESVTSLGSAGRSLTLRGTSVAVPFVTGAIALLWSEFPAATAAQIKLAATQALVTRRTSVAPPLLDAAASYHALLTATTRTRAS